MVSLTNITGMTIANPKATTASTGVTQCYDADSITVTGYLVYKLNGTTIHTSTTINSGTWYGRFMSQGATGKEATASDLASIYKWTLNTNPSTAGDQYYGINSGTASDWGDVVGFYSDRGVLTTTNGILEGAGNYPGTSLGSNHTLVSGNTMEILYAIAPVSTGILLPPPPAYVRL